VEAAAWRAAQKLPTGKVAAVRPVAERVVAADIVSNLDPLEADDHAQAVRAAARRGPSDGDLADGWPAIQPRFRRRMRR
jgi:hypothetical protein